MQDAWRAYLELALGLTEASRKKAQKVAKKLVSQGGATAAQLQALAEEMVSTSAANREALTKLVRFEVDRALGAVGLATAEEVADLNVRVRELERDLREARALAATAPSAPAVSGPDAGGSIGEAVAAEAMTQVAGAPSPEAVATERVGKKAVARTAVAKKAVTKKAVAKKAVAKKAVAKKAIAKRAVPEKAVARRTTPTKVVGKKTTTRQVGAAGTPPAAKSGVARKSAAKKQPPVVGPS
jgi:polyhydroxyalkanoate synthesis regulator phasin